MFLLDNTPIGSSFYNGDIDGGGPLTGVVDFNAAQSGLTYTKATDLGFLTLQPRRRICRSAIIIHLPATTLT